MSIEFEETFHTKILGVLSFFCLHISKLYNTDRSALLRIEDSKMNTENREKKARPDLC